MPFAIRPEQKVLFTGDSITDCGRRGEAAPLGSGYVRNIADLIAARYPAQNLEIINTGIGGNSVRDLRDRWTDDVIRHRPDWLSVMIGINDLHGWLRKRDAAVSPEEFAELYEMILARTARQTRARVILIDPFYISTDATGDSWRALVLEHLPKYIATVHRMARRYKTRLVRTQQVFGVQLKHVPPDRFCPEPVHPNPSGHLVIAHAWLKEMGW